MAVKCLLCSNDLKQGDDYFYRYCRCCIAKILDDLEKTNEQYISELIASGEAERYEDI